MYFSNCIPKFNFFKPTFFLEDNGLPFDSIVRDRVLDYCSDKDFKTEEVKSIYYKNKSDFAAFNKLFGSYKDGRNIVTSTMTDLGEIIGRDKFYNRLLAGDKAAKARGEPGMFYKTYAAARAAMPNPSRFKGRDIIESRQGLKLDNPLGDLTYTSTNKNKLKYFSTSSSDLMPPPN